MSAHRVVCIDYWAGELCNVAFSNFQERRREEKKSYALYKIFFFFLSFFLVCHTVFSLGLLSWMCSACWTDSFKLFCEFLANSAFDGLKTCAEAASDWLFFVF